MSVSFRRTCLVAGLAAASVATSLLLGCDRQSSVGSRIGIAVALNPQRAGMQSIYNGVELAVAEMNAEYAGRLNGAQLVMRKGASNVIDPVQIADTFRSDPTVVGVVGHPESGTTLAAIDEYADTKNGGRDGVVAISPTGTSPALSGANRWLFRVCPSDVQSSRAVARFVVDSLKAMRASIIYRNDSYGKDWAKSFAESYRDARGTIVQRDPYLQGQTSWDAYARYIKLLKPDVILFPGNAEDALVALRALRAVGVNTPMVGGDALSGLDTNAAEFPDTRYTAFFLAARASTPHAKGFVEHYTAAYREVPDQRAALAYDAARLIGLAVVTVGPSRARIRDFIESIGRTVPAMDGVAGPIAFDERHDVKDKLVVITKVGQ